MKNYNKPPAPDPDSVETQPADQPTVKNDFYPNSDRVQTKWTTYPDGSQNIKGYDVEGILRSETATGLDGSQNAKEYGYAEGQLTIEVITDPNGWVVHKTYHPNGELESEQTKDPHTGEWSVGYYAPNQSPTDSLAA